MKTTFSPEDVFIYRNLTKKCWSVKSRLTGRVIRHAAIVFIENGEFHVSQKGRERVVREKKKYVHAGVRGKISDNAPTALDNWTRVRYNPYNNTTFVTDEGTPINHADGVYLTSTGQVYACGIR